MEVRNEVRKEIVDFFEDEFLFLDGLDDAIVGVINKDEVAVVVYSISSIIKILMDRDDMDMEEAWEYFYYNIKYAYVGEKTPIFIKTFPQD